MLVCSVPWSHVLNRSPSTSLHLSCHRLLFLAGPCSGPMSHHTLSLFDRSQKRGGPGTVVANQPTNWTAQRYRGETEVSLGVGLIVAARAVR